MESRPKKVRKTEEEDGGQNAEIPPEIIEAILSRVPVKPLCRFKLVSKSWQSLISDPDFVSNYNKDVFFQRQRLLFTVADGLDGEEEPFTPQYRHLYSLDLDKFLNQNHDGDSLVAASTELDYFYGDLPDGILGWEPFVPFSCHGLFMSELSQLTSPDTDIGFILSNPVTQQSKTIPNPPICEQFQWWLYGLEFDSSTNEHKVIYGHEYKDYGIVFSVYTLQTDAWRKIGHLYPYEGRASNGIVVNGAVHWLVKKLAGGEWVIISFLLAEEKVEEIELPPNYARGFGLGAFRNSLCLTSLCHSESETHNEFWVMKEYGVRESWTKIKVSKPYKKLSHSGFWTETHDLMVFDQSSLVMCNFGDGTSWDLPIGDLGEDCSFGSVGAYVECLPSKVESSVFCRNEAQAEA
ncbi:hypothetical protein ACLB2K_071286 [Fragaria x ananassa]